MVGFGISKATFGDHILGARPILRRMAVHIKEEPSKVLQIVEVRGLACPAAIDRKRTG
jgi:hypothetical protein